MGKDIKIIGSGFSSLASACYLAKKGHEVTVFEKNGSIGGRARQLKKEGFTLIWGLVGTGCPMFLSDFSVTSIKNHLIITS